MIIYRNRLKYLPLRCALFKSALLIFWIICCVGIPVVMNASENVMEYAMPFVIVSFCLVLAVTIYMFISKKEHVISSLAFNDEKKLLSVEYYRYCYQKLSVDIPYEKLWYEEGAYPPSLNFRSTPCDSFIIEMREIRSQLASISICYSAGAVTSVFSEEEFIEIDDKLVNVGQSL